MPETWETQVQLLDGEDPLEEGMATQLQYSCQESSVDRGDSWATFLKSQRAGQDWSDLAHTHAEGVGSLGMVVRTRGLVFVTFVPCSESHWAESSLLIAPFLMQGQIVAGESLPSWDKSAQSTVLADATRNFSFGASDWNELYVSWDPQELSGSVKLLAPVQWQDKERNDCQCLEGVCRVGVEAFRLILTSNSEFFWIFSLM